MQCYLYENIQADVLAKVIGIDTGTFTSVNTFLIENDYVETVILGRYIITPKIFEILEKTAPGKGNEIQLTDALLKLIEEEAMYAYDFEGRRYDVGDKLGFLEATVEYALRKEDLRDGFIDYLKTIIK